MHKSRFRAFVVGGAELKEDKVQNLHHNKCFTTAAGEAAYIWVSAEHIPACQKNIVPKKVEAGSCSQPPESKGCPSLEYRSNLRRRSQFSYFDVLHSNLGPEVLVTEHAFVGEQRKVFVGDKTLLLKFAHE